MSSLSPIKLLVFLSAIYSSAYVEAHPHDWIDVKSTFVINDDSKLTQIKQRWTFDVYFSMIVYAELMNEHGDEEKGLRLYGEQMVKNLAEFDYFSNLFIDDTSIDLGEPKDIKLLTNNDSDPMLLELEMSFEIDDAESVTNKKIEWLVFDPTFYVAMIQEDENSLNVTSSLKINCQTSLHMPDPSDEVISYAQSLDKDQTDTLGLGIQFAERAVLKCL